MSKHRITPLAALAAALAWLAVAAPAMGYEAWNGETTTGINLRQAPSLAGTVITALEAGERLQVTASEGNWLQVVVNGEGYGFRGWVYGSYVRQTAAPPAADTVAPAAPPAPLQPSPGVETSADAPQPRPAPPAAAPVPTALSPAAAPEGPSVAASPASPGRGTESLPPRVAPPAPAAAANAALEAPPTAVAPATAPVTEAAPETKPVAAPPAVPSAGLPAAAPVAAAAPPPPPRAPGVVAYLQLALRLATTILACMALLIALRAHRMARAAMLGMGVGETVPPSPWHTTAGRAAAGRLGPIRA